MLQSNKANGVIAPAEFASLNDAEQVAFWDYSRAGFRHWNRSLRLTDGQPKVFAPQIKVCCAALAKLPCFDGLVFRVELNLEKSPDVDAKPGEVFVWHGFTSTGHCLKTLQHSEFAAAVEWHILPGHSGRRIEFASANQGEGEILLAPGSRMRVVDRRGGSRPGEVLVLTVQEEQ